MALYVTKQCHEIDGLVSSGGGTLVIICEVFGLAFSTFIKDTSVAYVAVRSSAKSVAKPID